MGKKRMPNECFLRRASHKAIRACTVCRRGYFKTKLFFAHRINSNRVEARNPRPKPKKDLLEAGFTSKAGMTAGFQTNGQAILDTGASRSVIGDEKLPQLLNQLPDTARDRVKERASRVAFCFGNSQKEHSHKQILIPIVIVHRKTRL